MIDPSRSPQRVRPTERLPNPEQQTIRRAAIRRESRASGPLAGRGVLLMLTAAAMTCAVSPGCRTAPVSGRKQLVLIPESQEIQLGVQAYEETLAEEPLSQDEQIRQMVERVGQRIAAVAAKPEYDWEFRVIAKNVQNAFALPGGKVAVYEGILPVCQSEAGLAVVMSHEVAHALARHGGERMSQQSVVQGVGTVVNAVSQRKADEATTQKIMQVYGASSQYGVILPFSRKHESEADAIGLILMAKAGYDPSVAPEFWERFSAGAGAKPPEWLSTHPADARRAADLRALLPEAMKVYEAAQDKLGMGEPIPLAGLSAPNSTVQPDASDVTLTSATYLGDASSLTGKQAGKKQPIQQAVHTEVARPTGETSIEPASADFQLPVKTGSGTPATPEDWANPTDDASNSSAAEGEADGWQSTSAPQPAPAPNPFE